MIDAVEVSKGKIRALFELLETLTDPEAVQVYRSAWEFDVHLDGEEAMNTLRDLIWGAEVAL